MADDCIGNPSNTPSPVYRTSGTPVKELKRLRRIPQPVTGYDLYSEEFGDTGFYMVCPQAGVNLLKNPTFYHDLYSWDAFNSQMQRTNLLAYDSGFSIMVSGSGDDATAERREYVESEIGNFTPGETYTFSMYGWMPLNWDLSDPVMGTISIVDVDGGGGEEEVYSERIEYMGMWNRLEVTKTIRTDAEQVLVRLNLRSQDQQSNNPPDFPATGEFNLANEYVLFDMGQFEVGWEATLPFHGAYGVCGGESGTCSSGAYSWSGVAHRSASTRSECAKDSGVLCSFNSLGIQVLSHTGHGAPPVRDISFPYANRPGEFYSKTAVDARILTFTVAYCGTLRELECELFNTQNIMMPDLCGCGSGQFMLVYKNADCNDAGCNPETSLALCVSYIGGFEGVRDNLFQQRFTLQFKAHQPFWFSWPQQQSAGLNIHQFTATNSVVKWNSDGSISDLPISGAATINTVSCMAGTNRVLVGGSFDTVDGGETCTTNVAVIDCSEVCDLVGPNSTVTASTTDPAGNVIVGTDVGELFIYYANGGQGSFPGYAGGAVNDIVAPFWAQIAVASDSGVYIQLFDGTWLTYTTDGPVNDLAMAPNGNLVAVGDFTTIDGVAAERIAQYNVNVDDCLDTDSAQWEAYDFGFDAEMNAVAIGPDGAIYVGGSGTETVPVSEEICNLTDDQSVTSTGSDQEVRFTDLGGGQYRLEFHMTNIIARETLANCTSYIRITASSSAGTKYSFLFGTHNVVAGPVTGTAGALFTIYWDVDVNAAIGDPCETLNTEFVNELTETTDFIQFVTPLNLPGGVGIDDTLGSIIGQCVELSTVFSADPVTFNGILKIDGDTAEAMGDGLPGTVNTIMVHPSTGEVWAGFEVPSSPFRDGLAIFNGNSWRSFPGYLGGFTERSVIHLEHCPQDCSVIIVFDGTGRSIVPGWTEVNYNGSADHLDAQLLMFGPGRFDYFAHNGSGNKVNLCLELQCDEAAVLDFGSGQLTSNHRSNLGSSIETGSRLDVCLTDCDPNNISLFVDPANIDATTKAALVWRSRFWSLEGLCCSDLTGNGPSGFLIDPEINCCRTIHEIATDPNDQYCRDQGYSQGDMIYNGFGVCPSLFISINDTCPDCEENAGAFVDNDGGILEDEDGEVFCPEDAECD